MKILLIEDDKVTSSFIVKGLKQEGYSVDVADNGVDGLDYLCIHKYDVAVIDIMLPKLDGLSVVRLMRKKQIGTPVIILSAKNSVDDRIKGLQGGSDDYLTKPFAFTELVARIQALMRRFYAVTEPTLITVGDLSIDIIKHKVMRGAILIDIQPLEYMLLEYLMRNAGRVVSKTMIIENVWDYNFDPQTNVVEARICKLREKIDKNFDTKLIHTERGFGYVIEAR